MTKKKLEGLTDFSISVKESLQKLVGGNTIAEQTSSMECNATQEGACSDTYSILRDDDGKCTTESCAVQC